MRDEVGTPAAFREAVVEMTGGEMAGPSPTSLRFLWGLLLRWMHENKTRRRDICNIIHTWSFFGETERAKLSSYGVFLSNNA